MSDGITYVFRKRLSQYHSIEELFGSIRAEVSKIKCIESIEMKHSGASPKVILKNIFRFRKNRLNVYHITGDVHYMALKTGKNSVLTIHDVKSATHGNIFKQLYIRLFWFWLPALFVKRLTVISEFTKWELEKIVPFAKQKIRVVHNPVNAKLKPTPYVFNNEKPSILFIGTKANKNLERSLQALANYPCTLTIVGTLSNAQKELLNELKLEFVNKTNLNFNEIITCYEQCDLLCFASIYEGFGMPIIEAQSIGRPVVTANFGAMLEVANNTACMVDAFDAKSIRSGIEKICDNQHFREQLIQKGFENIKRFQLSKITATYLEIYEEVLNN